jgi:catalase-peroxidase
MLSPVSVSRAQSCQAVLQQDQAMSACRDPTADGFRNYVSGKQRLSAEELLVDRAQLLTLTAPEMTVLVGGPRV